MNKYFPSINKRNQLVDVKIDQNNKSKCVIHHILMPQYICLPCANIMKPTVNIKEKRIDKK